MRPEQFACSLVCFSRVCVSMGMEARILFDLMRWPMWRQQMADFCLQGVDLLAPLFCSSFIAAVLASRSRWREELRFTVAGPANSVTMSLVESSSSGLHCPYLSLSGNTMSSDSVSKLNNKSCLLSLNSLAAKRHNQPTLTTQTWPHQ